MVNPEGRPAPVAAPGPVRRPHAPGREFVDGAREHRAQRRGGGCPLGLIASQLLGLGLMRYIWEVEPIASMSDDEVIAAVSPTIQRYIDDDIAPARKRTRRTSARTTNAG